MTPRAPLYLSELDVIEVNYPFGWKAVDRIKSSLDHLREGKKS